LIDIGIWHADDLIVVALSW